MTILFPDAFEAEALTIQQLPQVAGRTLRFGETVRGPLLPAKGSREREWKLRQVYYHDYNTLFRGGVSGLIKRMQSTPYEVLSKDADRWQTLLMNADFGDWDRFLAKIATNFSRYDGGAWVEIIAPGDPLLEPSGPAVGMAVLDSLRCYPTGNPMYPVIYYDTYGKMHIMHRARVVQLVDAPESEEYLWGYGDCALSRAIAPVYREILIGRYIEQYLDDKPSPGFTIFGNLSEQQIERAVAKLERERSTDGDNTWGRNIQVYGLDAASKPTIETVSYAKAPEGFDYEKYKQNNVREIALAIGLDIQDMWELSGGGIGTGTQSEILAQKSRGKAFGRLLKGIERMVNRILPESAEFRWQYTDPQEDLEQAEKANSWAGFISLAGENLTADEKRLLLANQVPAMKDVLIDADGNMKRLDGSDPKAPDEPTIGELLAQNAPQPLEDTDTPDIATTLAQLAPQILGEGKSLSDASASFERRFGTFIRVAIAQRYPPAILRATFRGELYDAGVKAYDQGLADGGAQANQADDADRQQRVSTWLALQNNFVDAFSNDVFEGKVSKEAIASRAALWVNKSLRTIYYAGLNAAAGETAYRWKLGPTEEHCTSCLTLNGVVRKLKDWLSAGVMPGSDRLKCKGFNCACELKQTSEAPGGRFPPLPSVGVLGIRDPFGSFLARLAGRKSIDLHLHEADVMDRFIMAIGTGAL